MHRYIHAVFTTENGERDDVEFLFSAPSVDATVNIRAASRTINYQDGGRNRNRLEKLRMSLTWQQVCGCFWLPSRALQVKYLLDFAVLGVFKWFRFFGEMFSLLAVCKVVVYIPPVVDSFFREHDNWRLVLQNGKAEMSFFDYCWKQLSLDFWVCQRHSLKDHCCKTQCMAFLGWTTGTHFKKQAATPVLYWIPLGYIWARATSHFWLQRSLGVFPRVVVAICQLVNFPLESPTPSRIAILCIEQDVLCQCLPLRHTKHSEFALVKHSLCLNLFLPL